MGDIKDRINSLTELDSLTVENIMNDIEAMQNDDEKLELYDAFVKKVKETLITSSLENTEIGDKFEEFVNATIKSSLGEEAIREIINENNFSEQEIFEKRNSRAVITEKEIDKINSRIAELEVELGEKNLEEIDEEIKRLESEKANKIKEINKKLEKINIDKEKEPKVDTLQEWIAAKEKLEKIVRRPGRLATDEETKALQLFYKASSRPTGENNIKDALASANSLSNGSEIKVALINAINKLENHYNPNKKEDKEKEPKVDTLQEWITAKENLIEEVKRIQSEYDKKVENFQELKRLKIIRDTYNKIMNDAMEKFKDEKDVEKDAINEFVDNHDLLPELDKYNNSEKLKQELKEDIYNNLKKKKIDKKEKNKKMLYKALAGVAGFVTGLGFSAVPGVGTIRMTLAGAKLGASAINVYAKKHPEGKVAKIIDAINEKKEVLNNKLTAKFPKIMGAVDKARNFIKKHEGEIKWFVNGFAAGYLTGNVIEMVSGKSIWEHLTDEPEKGAKAEVAKSPTPEPTPEPTPTVVDNPIEPTPPIEQTLVPNINPADITLNPGDVIDVSGIEYGLVSPDATNAVHLMNEVGKQVEVDKFVQMGEKTMVHLKQMNGVGYAWFDLADIQELLAESTEVAKGMKM